MVLLEVDHTLVKDNVSRYGRVQLLLVRFSTLQSVVLEGRVEVITVAVQAQAMDLAEEVLVISEPRPPSSRVA